MAELSPVSWQQLLRRLRELGFEGPVSGGKHPFMLRGNLVLTIPNRHRKDVSVDLLSRILRQANISSEQWLGSGESLVSLSGLSPPGPVVGVNCQR